MEGQSRADYQELRNHPDMNLMKEDIMDSLAFIELVEELENQFDIEIQPTQIPNDTWDTVDNIVKMVESLKNEE